MYKHIHTHTWYILSGAPHQECILILNMSIKCNNIKTTVHCLPMVRWSLNKHFRSMRDRSDVPSHHEWTLYHGDTSYSKWPVGRKEGNVLFNDALNTFYLRLYGVKHMVKNHSDSESGNLLPPHRLLFPISSKGSFICINHPTDRIIHTTAFVTPVVEHWLEKK